jgi:hypothetical protein
MAFLAWIQNKRGASGDILLISLVLINGKFTMQDTIKPIKRKRS